MSHHPRKRFGQHFLQDAAVIARIIAALHPLPTQHVVEIGPGQGALTFPLLEHLSQLEVIEYDRDLVALLERAGTALIIHEADALHFDFAALKTDERLLHIVGNLPYNIATPLLFHLFTHEHAIETMLFMVQKEVALRLSAEKGNKSYGRLSVMAQYHCHIELLFDVPPSAFYPKPQVTSSMVRLTPYHPLPFVAHNMKVFERLVRQAFSMRRKILHNSLKGMIDESLWARMPVSPLLRPEHVSVADFVMMSNMLSMSA